MFHCERIQLIDGAWTARDDDVEYDDEEYSHSKRFCGKPFYRIYSLVLFVLSERMCE